MKKVYFALFCCLFWASAASAQKDAIDLSKAVVHNSPADIASWSRTTAITGLHMRPDGSHIEGLSFDFSAHQTWPDYTPPGWDGPIQYTVWAGVKIKDVWHVSGIIQMWRERGSTGAPILTNNNFAINWCYDGRWGPMNGYQPVAGEAMIFFVTAGDARGVTKVTSVRERSNVVMVNLPGNDNGDFSFAAASLVTDLVVDYGAEGIWTLTDGTTFTKIHPLNPRNIVTGDFDGNGIDEVAVDFGPGGGLWILWNNSTWVRLSETNPNTMVVGDFDNNGLKDLVVDFPGAGVYVLMNGWTFAKIHDLSPSRMLVADIDGGGFDLVIEFPGSGIWILFNNRTWLHLHDMNSSLMVAGNFDGVGFDDLAIVFPGSGIWLWSNGWNWFHLSTADPVRLAVGNVDANPARELVADYPGYGIWMLRNGSAWTNLHWQPEQQIVLADLDGNGQDEVIVDFGNGAGIWIYANDSTWMQVTSFSPEAMVPAVLN